MKTLGILAGGGDLPALVVAACEQQRRPRFVVAFEGETTAEVWQNSPHLVVPLERVGAAIRELKRQKITELVLVGPVGRPELTKLRPDITTVRLISTLLKFRQTGDDALFKAIVAFLESEGFAVVGVQEVVPELIAPQGVLGKHQPDARAQNDMSLGVEVARHIGAYDIGQGVVVQGGRVLGVEAAEGTDALLARVKALQHDAPGGVLVKVKKPQQDSRIDLPAVGPNTIENAHAAGLRGIAVEAGNALMIHREQLIARADRLGLFVYGISTP